MQFIFNNLNALRCPITHELFIEPVIGSDCHTYERTAILDWLKRKEISPMTCEPMSINSLRSNLVMKNIIEELLQLNKINKDTSPPPIPPRQSSKSLNFQKEFFSNHHFCIFYDRNLIY
jgi:SUMO ligase MMS21 Smc5/6 complex component